MTEQRGTLEAIATLLAQLIQPLEDRIDSGDILLLLEELGLRFPASTATDASLAAATGSAVTQLQRLPTLVSALVTAVENDDIGQIISAGLDLANAIRQFIQAAEDISTALQSAGAGGGIPPAELAQFTSALPGRLLDYLAVRKFEGVPGAANLLDFIGFVERTAVPAVDAAHPAFIRRQLHFDQLFNLVQDPAGHFRNLYQWGDPGFDGHSLLQKVYNLLIETGAPAVLDTSGPVPVLDVVFLEISAKTDVTPRGLLLKLAHPFQLDSTQAFQQDAWQVSLKTDMQLATGSQLIFQPNDQVTFLSAGGQVSGDLLLKWTAGSASGPPFLLLGETGASRVEVQQFSVITGVGFAWDAANNHATGAFKIGGEIKNAKVVINLAGADGFLGTLLSGIGLESVFSLGLTFSTQGGLTFEGSATLEVQLPIHISLGPVDISALTLSVGIQNNVFPIGLAADISASLGPLQAAVQQIGFQANLSIPPDHHGNIGPANFDLSFKSPKGVGLSINAGVVQGGGFLYIDTDRGEYAGALELVFADFLSLHAIGLITTKMPDGSSGFSLLVIITADFGTGIQLGFGFTLLGVGGLLGLNRIMLLQPLMDGVRTGSINSIMFPQNVVANAPRIISDLRGIFPPQLGIFLIGPEAKMGWGEPTLVSLALGVIIEIPGDIAILGVLKLALPADDVAVIVIQVNFAGAIEFDKKRMYFFASLFDSRVLFITIEGEMGMLFGFGDNANFVVSVGGFHPQYTPPPLPFPNPRRIEIDILNESYARIRCDGYFSVTSDTVQFGAHVDMFFGFSAVSVSGHIGFDALIQFSPFHFVVSFSASFSVQVFGTGVFGIDIEAQLSGPTPWNVQGKASLSFLFFSIGINIDVTWGDSRSTLLPPIPVMPLLSAEFSKQSNWRAVLPDHSHLMVTLRKLGEAEAAFLLHPVGTLHISQRAIPLDLTLDKVGNQKPNDANRFVLTVASAGLAKTAKLQEQFAPSQFQNFDDATKLSQPGYEPMDSGIELSAAGTSLASGTAITRVVRYDLTVIDTKYRRYAKRFFSQAGALFNHFLRGASVTKCALSAYRAAQMQPVSVKVAVGPETFAVVLRSNNTVFSAEAVAFTSQAAAHDYLNRAVASNSSLAGTLHVLPQFEVAA